MTDAPVIKGARSIQIFLLRLVDVQLHLHLWNPTTIHHNFDHGSRQRARSFNNDAISFRRFLVAATNKQITHGHKNKIWRFSRARRFCNSTSKIGLLLRPLRSCAIRLHHSEKSNTVSGKIEVYSTKLSNFIEITFNKIIISYYSLHSFARIIIPFRYPSESGVSRFIAVANRDHEYTCRKKHNRFGGTRRRTGDIRRGVAYSSHS